jgi:hypothetical protein
MELEEIEQLGNFLITQGAETIAATELQNEVSQAVACRDRLESELVIGILRNR